MYISYCFCFGHYFQLCFFLKIFLTPWFHLSQFLRLTTDANLSVASLLNWIACHHHLYFWFLVIPFHKVFRLIIQVKNFFGSLLQHHRLGFFPFCVPSKLFPYSKCKTIRSLFMKTQFVKRPLVWVSLYPSKMTILPCELSKINQKQSMNEIGEKCDFYVSEYIKKKTNIKIKIALHLKA